jgi:hypothetical protein
VQVKAKEFEGGKWRRRVKDRTVEFRIRLVETHGAAKNQRTDNAKENIRNLIVQFSACVLGARQRLELRKSLVAPSIPNLLSGPD